MLAKKMEPVPVAELEEADRAVEEAIKNVSGPEAEALRDAIIPAFNLYAMAWARLHMNATYYIA